MMGRTMSYVVNWQKLQELYREASHRASDIAVSTTIRELLIAAEDHRYGCHPGVDPIAICRATWHSLVCGKIEGGSTIAMQLVRTLTGRYERTISRKVLEMYLALKLTKTTTRDELASVYLSVAYYGWRMNGLAQASSRLGIDFENTDLRSAATLIARLKYPEPKACSVKRQRQIRERANYIMKRYINGSRNSMKPRQLLDQNGSF